ncbi:MAG: TldD/PmbA family protein [Candidatus Eremiobacteraeota bacterium]|nr:TldD/PmbA family protein [Candidatus Eremiobacteraeota bacterium]MBV9276684.1 TldD/PmbA family protein [Candidatus Eremiobacteraeota bacterium]
MLNSHEREELAAHMLSYSDADQSEVVIATEDAAWSRFTQNSIHQNLAYANAGASIRTIVDHRTGVAATNVLTADALQAAVRRAIAMARLAPQDPAQPPLPQHATYMPADGAFAEATAQATPQQRAQLCEAIFRSARSRDFWCAGFARTTQAGISVVNSHGARASFDGTDAAINVKMNAPDSTGYAEAYTPDVTALDAAALGELSAQKAAAAKAPRAVPPGHWTVILEPAAFGEFFNCITRHFSAQAVDEGSSFLCDALDRKCAGTNVTIWDDYAHPLAPGMPFDFEGAPTQRVALVKDGVAAAYVTDSYWAAKLSKPNTGHALPAPNTFGPMPRQTVVEAGSKPLEQLIAETERGLLITRFWYLRPVDERRTIITGMTRDGTFMIEGGKVTHGVRNLRFNQSVLEALGACEFSNTQHRTASYHYSTVVPAVKIERFTFSSETDF